MTVRPNSFDPIRQAAVIIRKLEERLAPLEKLELAEREPIAIVGVGCRFPGGGDGPAAFWELLDEARDAIRPLDPRWGLVGWRPRGNDVPAWAGLLDRVDGFDPGFFGISPREASSLDPQHRLLLEVTWEALEDAGILPASLEGSRTGVFIGACTTDYRDMIAQLPMMPRMSETRLTA